MRTLTRLVIGAAFATGCHSDPAPRVAPAETPAAAAPVTPAHAPGSEPITLLDVPAGSAFDTTVRNSAKDDLANDDESRIYQQMRTRLPLVNACYSRERRIDPTLAGKLTLQVTVGPAPTGTVTGAEVISRSLNSTTVEGCVIDTVKRLAFQRTGPQPITLHLPLVFR